MLVCALKGQSGQDSISVNNIGTLAQLATAHVQPAECCDPVSVAKVVRTAILAATGLAIAIPIIKDSNHKQPPVLSATTFRAKWEHIKPFILKAIVAVIAVARLRVTAITFVVQRPTYHP